MQLNAKSFIASCLLTYCIASPAFAFDTAGKAAILLDAETGSTLFEKEADKPIPPASMSKLMTVYLAFEALKKGQLKEDTELYVSENARKQEGSRMFIEVGSKVKVIDLLHGAIIQSGNDACVVLAEGIAGSVEEFASLMNKKAEKLGLKNSHFMNPTGLPDPEHYMSVKDLAILAGYLIRDFPDYYKIYGIKSFTWNGITQGNRNPLLYTYEGADGLKTGHTSEAGYGLVGSAFRRNMRLISVISGLKSMNQRASESRKLLDYGFGRFTMRQIGVTNFKVAQIPVYLGSEEFATAVIKDVKRFPVQRGTFDEPKMTITYKAPLTAPIEKGTEIATLTIKDATDKDITVPLYAKEDVKSASLWKRFLVSFRAMLGIYEVPKLNDDKKDA